MRAYAEKLMRKAPHLVDDVLQEAFLTLSSKLNLLSTLSDIQQAVYIEKTVKSTARDMLNHEKVLLSFTSSYEVESTYDRTNNIPLEHVCSLSNFEVLKQAIRDLPDHYRDVLELHYINEWSLKKISVHLGLDYATVRKHHERAKALLIRKLLQGGYEHDFLVSK